MVAMATRRGLGRAITMKATILADQGVEQRYSLVSKYANASKILSL